MHIERVYSDDDITVIIKPSMVPSEDGKLNGVASLLNSEDEKHLVIHRLDKEVSGLMVLAKNSFAAAAISKQIVSRDFKKEYLTVVEGNIEPEAELVDLLFYDRTKNKTYVVKKERKGVKKASLEFQKISEATFEGSVLSLVRVKLKTGRTHQIRVQFASRKHPVFGDRKYGSKFSKGFALFSSHLEFLHPRTGELLSFDEVLPNEKPWNIFQKA